MFKRLFKKTPKLAVTSDADSPTRLLNLAKERGSLALDAAVLAELGMSLGLARRVAWLLAWREQLHIMAEPDGELILLSNPQFEQIAKIRVMLPAAASQAEPEKILETELAWFQLEVASEELAKEPSTEERKTPETRKKLPERSREPWVVREAAGAENKNRESVDFS